MLHFREVARLAAGLVATSAVLAFGALAFAQTSEVQALDAPAPTQAQLEARAEARASSAAAVMEALSGRPIAANRLVMGHRLIKAMDMETGLQRTLDATFATLRAQMLENLPAATPAPRQAAFAVTLDEAVAETKADILEKLSNGPARYFALRVDPEALTETAAFFESPLGRHWIVSRETMSETDNRALSEYGLTHPALIEVYSAVPGSVDMVYAIVRPGGAPMKETLRTRLCRSLQTRGATEATCHDAAAR
jgi:hypothetical protein